MYIKVKQFSVIITLAFILLLAMTFSATRTAESAARNPFLGHWFAVDSDGSFMGLNIGGPLDGPFRLTWTDDYISYCGGEAGIILGMGTLNESDPTLLEADLTVECFTSGETLSFHLTFRYNPLTRTLSCRYENGRVVIWRRSYTIPDVPGMGLRVNYGDDWVESFYEAGHTVWLTVTESDGWTVKATAEVITEPKDFWGGETGFQTAPESWSPGMPDIQPYDWVFAWVDNGASAQVQIGEINGRISTSGDFISGSLLVPWFFYELETECHPWGSPEPVDMKYALVYPDGGDEYTCSWAGTWDIQPGQPVGVGYYGLDGHWVANAFYAPDSRIVASESGDWFWTSGFYPGTLDISIYASQGGDLLWSGQAEVDEGGFMVMGSETHGQDLVEGNTLVISDGLNTKELGLLPISVTVFEPDSERMAGYAPGSSEVWAAAGPQEWQQRLMAVADSASGYWEADFSSLPFDILEEYRPWSFAQIFDDDGDANEGSTPPPPTMWIWIEWNSVDGNGWGLYEDVSLTINGGEHELIQNTGYGTSLSFDVGAAGHDILPGDLIVMFQWGGDERAAGAAAGGHGLQPGRQYGQWHL